MCSGDIVIVIVLADHAVKVVLEKLCFRTFGWSNLFCRGLGLRTSPGFLASDHPVQLLFVQFVAGPCIGTERIDGSRFFRGGFKCRTFCIEAGIDLGARNSILFFDASMLIVLIVMSRMQD